MDFTIITYGAGEILDTTFNDIESLLTWEVSKNYNVDEAFDNFFKGPHGPASPRSLLFFRLIML